MDDATRGPDGPLLAALVGAAPVGMAMWDADLRCLWANGGLPAGHSGDAVVGATPEAVFGELGRAVEAMLRTALATGEPVIDAEITGQPSTGGDATAVWRVTCYPVRGLDGPATAVGALITDVTDRTDHGAQLRATEEHFRLLVEGVTDYAIVMLDTAGRVVTWNTGAERIMGYRAEQILGEHISRYHTPEAIEQREAERLLAEAASAGRVEVEGWRMRRDGALFWAGVVITALFAPDGALRGYSAVLRDLTQQRAAHEALRESESTLRSLLQSASDGVLVVDQSGTILSVNTRAEEMFDYPANDLVGQPIEVLVPDRLHDVHHRYRGEFMRSPHTRPMGRGLDLTARRRDGSELPVEVGLGTAQSGDATLVTVVVTDITERKQVEAQLAHQATHDALTGLPNRALFSDRLAQALARTPRRAPDNDKVAVLFFDLDRFKLINDSLGHQAGDQALVMVAERLRALLRPSDTVARFGGDEFAMLCEGLAGPRDAAQIAKRMLRRLSEPLVLAHSEHLVTPSIGIALANRADTDPEQLVRDADAAMYRAKDRGRARYELFDAELRAQTVARLGLETGLRRVVQRGELRLVYQPIMALGTPHPIGAEALLRWQRPGHGIVAPKQFIPIAEETGLITQIGAWVVHQACRQAKLWQATTNGAGLQVSVNLSVHQLGQTGIVDIVAEALQDADLDPQLLRLELTESALMLDPEASLVALRELTELGISVAIDDFGTGYSSLSRLRQFPVNALKVDREFVDGLGREPEDSAIVAAVISLAHAYGITTVAEGVETAEQVAILRDLGCEYAQGFYYAHPAEKPAFGGLAG